MIGASEPLSPEQWGKAREIYALALEEPAEERVSMALRLCDGDSQLESQMRNLLSANEQAGSFLIEPAIVALNCLPAPDASHALPSGTILATRFRIERLLNTGGMGSVYEAWDTELQEVVALKTIRPEIASVPMVIERFKEEVKQARRISHPNICRVYDLFNHVPEPGRRQWFLTMQLLEGRTLLQHVREFGPFSTREALPLIEQMASGLAAAHELGVIHRDFKSANIMLVADGGKRLRAVITDFGLAMRVTLAGSDASALSGQGTPAYAAPEQWRDGVAGPAGDQYSLGVVICEMLTGERPTAPEFDGDRVFPARLPAGKKLNPRWERALARCLEMRPEARFAAISEIVPALDPSRRRRAILRLMAAGAAVLLAIVALQVVAGFRQRPAISDLKQLTPGMDLSSSPNLSPDGSMIAYGSDRSGLGGRDIWVQRMPDGLPTRITFDGAENDEPSLSPDGRTVLYSSRRDHGGIYMANVAGGGDRLLARGGNTPRVSPDGRYFVYWTGDHSQSMVPARIYVQQLPEGKAVQLAPEFADARDAIWNSDGRHILFKGCPAVANSIQGCWDWWVTTVDGETPRKTGAIPLLTAKGITQGDLFDGWIGNAVLFNGARGRQKHLWILSLSPKDYRATGEPKELSPEDGREEVLSASLSDGKELALMDISSVIHVWRINHGTVPEKASAQKVTEDAQFDYGPNVSANGRWLIFARGRHGERDLWLKDMTSGREKPLFAPGINKWAPVIDDAGTTFAYQSGPENTPSVFLVRPGDKAPIEVCAACQTPTGWFNGNEGLLLGGGAKTGVQLYRLASGQIQTVLGKPGVFVSDATWSPANQYILFKVSSDRQQGQVFAARFPAGAAAPDSHWIAITNPSEPSANARWSGDGKTIVYFSKRDNFWCVWGQKFDSVGGKPVGKPFAVQHYHNDRVSASAIAPVGFNLSVAGDSVYLNVAEFSSTIWTGALDRSAIPFFSW